MTNAIFGIAVIVLRPLGETYASVSGTDESMHHVAAG
jgi:hypothetical protein